MMNPVECCDVWKKIVSIYRETCNSSPKETMKTIINEIGISKTKEIFATVAAIKKHDGRIDGINREYMNSIHVNHMCIENNSDNPVIYAGIDNIHTAHINQLITELRRCDNANC